MLTEMISFIVDNNPTTQNGGRSFRDALTGGNELDPPPPPIDTDHFPSLMDMNEHLGKPSPQGRIANGKIV